MQVATKCHKGASAKGDPVTFPTIFSDGGTIHKDSSSMDRILGKTGQQSQVCKVMCERLGLSLCVTEHLPISFRHIVV